MKHRTFFFVCFIFVIVSLNSVSVTSVKNDSVFTPSNEWKKVEEGQSIPAGLHVRINLVTGEKEAKLPDSEDTKKNALVFAGDENKENQENKDEKFLDPQKLKEYLKNVKPDESAINNLKGNFRSYENLKEEFKKLKLDVKSDLEILTELIENFKKLNVEKTKTGGDQSSDWSDDEQEMLTVLVDLEYLVHQIDNAQEFAKLNGFSDVIYACLNSSNSEIRSEALRLLGSATQSNPKVQIAALDSGAIHLLLKILTFDEDINVRSRSLYALSCLIRRFPAAQHKLIADGGLTAFAKIFDEEKQDLVKLQVKILTLMHDLLFERKDTKMNILEEEGKNQTVSQTEMLKEKLQQYEKIDFEKKLVEQEWCERISNWFTKQNHVKELSRGSYVDMSDENIHSESHDIIEKVVDTLYVLSDICKAQFQSDVELVNVLFSLRDVYSELARAESIKNDSEEESSQLYNSLFNVLNMLTGKLKGTTKKDEL